MRDQGIWFSYTKTAGRITARPANWQGWLALSVALIANLLFALLVWAAAASFHPLAGSVSLFLSLPLGLVAVLKMALRKGRPEA